MSFLDMAKARWTCRDYDPAKPVEQEKIDAILQAIALAPTAKNFQPFHVWVAQSDEAMEKVRQVTPCSYGAPLAFIIAYSADEAFLRGDGKNFGEIDASIAGTHIILEASDLGLGSTWIGAYDAAKLHELFPELEGYVDVALFAVGYPSASAQPSPRHSESKSLDDMVTFI